MAQPDLKKTDEALLLALACGTTVERAAQTSGLSVRSVYRRLANAEFRRRLQGVRDDMLHRAAGMLTAAAMEAVKTLLSLQGASVPATVRLGAARAILELSLKLGEASELTERIKALEERMSPP
jgi:hypothetical protein